MSNDLMYLLLENASHAPIRLHNQAQSDAARQLLKEGCLDQDPMTGCLIITEVGRKMMPELKRKAAHPNWTIPINKAGRKPSMATLEKHVTAFSAEASRWKHLAEVRQKVNRRLTKQIACLNAQAGTDAHVGALLTTIKEQDEMIEGLRRTIERLKADRDGRD